MLKKLMKKIPVQYIPGLMCIILAYFMIILVGYRWNVKNVGAQIGNQVGSTVGKMMGSLDGLTFGYEDGYSSGKKAGLSPETLKTELANKCQEISKLEVLAVSGTHSDLIITGVDYAAIVELKYTAVFTVDLTHAEYELKDGVLHILLDQPNAEFHATGNPKKVNEYQKRSWTGKTEDSFKVTLDVMNGLKENAEETLENNEGMMQAARVAAEDLLRNLAESISISLSGLQVEWRGEE